MNAVCCPLPLGFAPKALPSCWIPLLLKKLQLASTTGPYRMPLMIGVSKLPLGTNAPAMRSLQVALTDGPGIFGQTVVQAELSIEQCPCVQSEACWHARLLSLHVPPCGGQSEDDEQVSPVTEQV
jgi:hypothetical protein